MFVDFQLFRLEVCNFLFAFLLLPWQVYKKNEPSSIDSNTGESVLLPLGNPPNFMLLTSLATVRVLDIVAMSSPTKCNQMYCQASARETVNCFISCLQLANCQHNAKCGRARGRRAAWLGGTRRQARTRIVLRQFGN